MNISRFHIYEDASKEYRWRLLASDGRVVAESAQSYKNKMDCEAEIETVKGGTRAEGFGPVADEALHHLKRIVERHRLLFLYVALPKRRIAEDTATAWETLGRGEDPREHIPMTELDNDGEFLFKYRATLERFAQAAVATFGPGTGTKSTEFQAGKYVEVEGSSFPYWGVDELDCAALEQSSDAMLDACKQLARVDVDRRFQSLLRAVRALTHDGEQSRWYSCVLIRWDYLARLENLIASIKSAEIDAIANPPGTGNDPAPARVGEPVEDSDQPQAPSTESLPMMQPDQARTAGMGLLMLFAQAYYKMLESTISVASWCTALDLELNQAYFWVTQNLGNLLKNDSTLTDFPHPFIPLVPDLYPSTIRDLDWEEMVAGDAEQFLSAVQQYLHKKGYIEPQTQSTAWQCIELFRPSVMLAIDRAADYEKRMRQHVRNLMRQSRTAGSESQPAAVSKADPGEHQEPTASKGKRDPQRRLEVDLPTFKVSMDGKSLKFSGRGDKLFSLLIRISRRPGHKVAFESLREVGDVWDGYEVEDETIRGAVKRLRDKLRVAGLVALADAIRTQSFQGRQFVILDLDEPQMGQTDFKQI